MTTAAPASRLDLDDVEQVVADPLRFKAKLAIGENAYTSLRAVNRARELWDLLGAAGTGAAVAQSSVIAGTFFAPTGLLGVLGLGTAATPIGWVAFAAVASGGACYGLYRLLERGKGTRVIEIPRYLNTPLDTLGLALFDLLAPIALRMAAIDGHVSDEERSGLVDHLVNDWGFDPQFVTQAVACIEPHTVTGSIDAMAIEAAGFLHANPDCNHAAIANDYVGFLRQLLDSDGALSPDELAALAILTERLQSVPPSAVVEQWAIAKSRAGLLAGQVRGSIQEAAEWSREKLSDPPDIADRAARTLDQVRLGAGSLASGVGASMARLSKAVQGFQFRRKDE